MGGPEVIEDYSDVQLENIAAGLSPTMRRSLKHAKTYGQLCPGTLRVTKAALNRRGLAKGWALTYRGRRVQDYLRRVTTEVVR